MSFVEQRIKSILTNNQIEFEETEHEAVYTYQKTADMLWLHKRLWSFHPGNSRWNKGEIQLSERRFLSIRG